MTANALSIKPLIDSQNIFLADAVVSGAMALGLLAGAAPLSHFLGLPDGLLRWVALILLPFAVLMGWFATRPSMPTSAMWAFIGCNVLWVADSFLLLSSGWVQPTALGAVFVVGQAVAVGAFAFLETRLARNGR